MTPGATHGVTSAASIFSSLRTHPGGSLCRLMTPSSEPPTREPRATGFVARRPSLGDPELRRRRRRRPVADSARRLTTGTQRADLLLGFQHPIEVRPQFRGIEGLLLRAE